MDQRPVLDYEVFGSRTPSIWWLHLILIFGVGFIVVGLAGLIYSAMFSNTR
jgi:hypothetical protein